MLMRHTNKTYCHSARGFSLVELLLAMLIGIIIMGAVISMFITTRNTQQSSEDQLRLVSDARFAMDAIAYDLRHAGSWGANNNPETILCRLNDASCIPVLAAATGDCAALWYIDFQNALDGYDANNPYTGTCALNGYAAGTDTLGVKYADSSPIASVPANMLDANTAYIRSNVQTGQVFIGTAWTDYDQYKFDNTVAFASVTKNHRLVGHFYYVSDYTYVAGDGLPVLRRVSLGAGPQFTDSIFIPGVVDFQVEYGVDLTPTRDRVINSFVKASAMPTYTYGPNVGLPNWTRVHAVKIWLLIRAERPDRDGLTETRTFNLAGNLPTTIDTAYRHHMITSVIKLRNSR